MCIYVNWKNTIFFSTNKWHKQYILLRIIINCIINIGKKSKLDERCSNDVGSCHYPSDVLAYQFNKYNGLIFTVYAQRIHII